MIKEIKDIEGEEDQLAVLKALSLFEKEPWRADIAQILS